MDSGPAPVGASRNDDRGWGVRMPSHPKQLRIACLDLFALRLDAGRVLLHQLEVGELASARLRLHLAVRRILRGVIDEELLRLARVQPGLEQLCRVRMRRA